ncbi:unnamed protein product, partial [marine sediment metagenome]
AEENENGYNKVNNVKVKVPDDGETHKVTAERVKDAKGNKISAQSVWNYNIDSGETTTVELIGPGEYNIYVDGNIAKTETIK